jgi:hypothetical protein
MKLYFIIVIVFIVISSNLILNQQKVKIFPKVEEYPIVFVTHC